MIKNGVTVPLAVPLVAALPLVILTVLVSALVVVALVPGAAHRAHVYRLIGVLGEYAAIVRGNAVMIYGGDSSGNAP